MKNIKFLILLLLTGLALPALRAQFSPQLELEKQAENQARPAGNRLLSILRAGDNYWNTHNRFEKSNGLKPFERWKYIWEDYALQNVDPGRSWLEAVRQAQARPVSDTNTWHLVGKKRYTTSVHEGKGRVNAIAVDPTNDSIIYLGAPAGGLWKSTDAGQTWTPLTDHLPTLGVSAIAIDPQNPQTIYIGTGDDDALITPSYGVYKSTDGGQTWTNILGYYDHFVSQILINPANPQEIWVGGDLGVSKTVDGGRTWTHPLNAQIREMRLHPTDPSYVYAVSNTRFYRSTDGGDSFQQVSSALPNNASRLVMDVTPAAPDKVYVLAINGGDFLGVYISSNKGETFSKTNQNAPLLDGRQGWYDLCMTVSNSNPDIIFLGEVNIWKSIDGGNMFVRHNDWNTMNEKYTHADIHYLEYFGDKLYAGTDGGIYVSDNDGNRFRNLNNDLAISQFYRISVAKTSGTENIYGGLQDNGGIAKQPDDHWHIYHGADGMDNGIDLRNPAKAYSFIYYGNYLHITENGGHSTNGGVNGPEQGNWVTPLAVTSDNQVFGGFSKLYRLVNNTWQAVTTTAFSSRIDVMTFDPFDPSIVYVGVDNELFKSTDGGQTFRRLKQFNANITAIEINPLNHRVWVAVFDKVYRSDDDTTWENMSVGLPGNVKINDLQYHYFSPDTILYAANDVGVYKHASGQLWEPFGQGLPHTVCMDLELDNFFGKLWVGTHGRSVWVTDVPVYMPENDAQLQLDENFDPLRCAAVSEIPVLIRNNGRQTISRVNYSWDINGETGEDSWSGSLASGQSITVNIPITTVESGAIEGRVNLNYQGDQLPQNNEVKLSYLVNKSEEGSYAYDFENENQTLLHYSQGETLWERAQPAGSQLNSAASGQYAYCTNADGSYYNQTIDYLYLPCMDFSQVESATVSFDLAFDIETGWDALYMEYSTDGREWFLLGTADDPNWYNNTSVNGACVGGQWSGTETTFARYSHTLDSLAGEPHVYLRFVMASDHSITGEGAVIDNLQIEAIMGVDKNTLARRIKLYPNPVGSEAHIESGLGPVTAVEILDMSGKVLRRHTYREPRSEINLSMGELPAGTYLMRIHTDRQVLHKHFMKR